MRIVITLLFLVPHILLSQAEELVHWSNATVQAKGVFEGGGNSVYEEDNSLKLILTKKKKFEKILTLDSTLSSFSEEVYNLPYPDKKIQFSKVVELKHNKYAIFYAENKREHKFKLYSLLLKNDCCNEIKQIYEHKYRVTLFPAFPSMSVPSYPIEKSDIKNAFRFSEDSTQILFINQLSSSPSRKKEEVQLAVFDSNFELKWEQVVALPYTDIKLNVEEATISNDGKHIFLLAGYPKRMRYSYSLFHITPNDLSEIKLDLKKNCYPVAIFPMLDNKKNILAIRGLYINKKRIGAG